jgi:glycosyltransferase involved in cell wall biosynthesis
VTPTSAPFERAAPRVSVVVPAYNRERYVGQTIESVLAQTFDDWELVVYDDGSTDGTRAVAMSYAQSDRRISVGHGPNGGVAVARNRGFELTNANADFVIFLDSDDLWEPDALATLVSVLDAHPAYVASHCVARCIDDEGQPLPGDDLAERSRDRRGFRGGRLVRLEPDEPTTFTDFVYHNWVVTPGTQLMRREIVARVGGFDPAVDPADDADLSIRISRHGDMGFIDRPLLRWRKHPDTLTNTSPRWRAAALRVRAKTLTDLSNTPAQRHATRLAYVHSVGLVWRDGRDAAGNHAYREAFHDCSKAVYLYQAYLRACVRLRARRTAHALQSFRNALISARAGGSSRVTAGPPR